MRKVLAVLATITLCACFLSAFAAVSAEDAPSFDEVFAGEFAAHATAPEDWAVDGYWGPGGPGSSYVDDSFSGVGIDTGLNADGSMHVYRGGTSAGRIMTYTATSYVFDGAHIALGNITGVDHFSLELVNGEGGSGTSWIIFKNDGDMMQMYNGWGGEGTVLYEKSPVVAAMFEENAKSIIGCSIVDTYPVFSVTNHAGTMSATIHTALSPSVGWTENTEKVIFGFGDWNDPSTVQLDVYAIHGGDEACGEPVSNDPPAAPTLDAAALIAGDTTFYSATEDDLVSNNAYHSGGRIVFGEKADGGVHLTLTAASSARLGLNTADAIAMNGAHIVLGNLQSASGEFTLLIGSRPSESAGDHPRMSVVQFLSTGGIWISDAKENAVDGNEAVKALFEGAVTVIAFAVDEAGEVTMTVANEKGEAVVPFPDYGEEWTDHTSAYIGFVTNSADGLHEVDILAIHGGDVECGVDVNPDTEAVKAVETAIEAIGEVTLDSKAAIDAAHAAYDALTDAQKALVSNLNVLKAADFAYEALFYAQFRNQYNVNLPLKAGDIEALYATFVNIEQFEEGKGVIVDQWAPDTNTWAERTQLNHAVPLDGLRIVLTDLQTVRESGNTISIGLMDYAGQWVDADDSMIVWLFAPMQRQADGAGEYGYLHAENKKNGIQYSKCLWQSDFTTDIWSADQVVFEFAYDTDSETVGVFVNDQYMGAVTLEDLGVDDVNAVIPHFSLWGVGVCHYGVYSVTSEAQTEGIQAVIDAIDAIGEVDPDDEACLARIEAASEAYKALDKNLREYVTNYNALVDAKAKAEGLDTEEPSEPTEKPTEEPEAPTENPKTGEAVSVLPAMLLLTAAGIAVSMRKRRA